MLTLRTEVQQTQLNLVRSCEVKQITTIYQGVSMIYSKSDGPHDLALYPLPCDPRVFLGGGVLVGPTFNSNVIVFQFNTMSNNIKTRHYHHNFKICIVVIDVTIVVAHLPVDRIVIY